MPEYCVAFCDMIIEAETMTEAEDKIEELLTGGEYPRINFIEKN